MPRVKCNKCFKEETVLRAGFIRGKQRFFCKECNYHFTLLKKTDGEKSTKRTTHPTTIIDIAKVLGISYTTVSRALSNHPDISERTKELVKQVASDLNYKPNTLAQSLSKRETKTIGVIIPDIETYFFSSILTGIHNAASNAGYKVMISQSKESYKTEVEIIHTLANWVDGLLICHSKETKTFDHIKLHVDNGIPIVHFDRVCEELETSMVLLDDVNGSFAVTDHLLSQGCKRIVLISGPEHLYVCKKRLDGYVKALKKHRIAVDPLLICHTDLTIKSVLSTVDDLLEKDKSIDAIFSISDIAAIRIMVHLKNKGIKIPEQLCVAGFGNEPMGEIIEPSMTSFNLQTYKLGETVTQLFLAHLAEGDLHVPKTKIIKGNLVVRASSSKKTNIR